MKKILALMLALICLMSFAIADAIDVPSKDTGSMIEVKLDEKYDGLTITVGAADELPADIAKALADQLAKLAASTSISDYFKPVKDANEEETTLKDFLGEEPAKVAEFTTMSFDGYEEEMENVIITFTFATPYEKDEKVAVLIGFLDTDMSVEWYVLEGVGTGEDGAIEVEVPADFAARIEETPAEYVLLAVASL